MNSVLRRRQRLVSSGMKAAMPTPLSPEEFTFTGWTRIGERLIIFRSDRFTCTPILY